MKIKLNNQGQYAVIGDREEIIVPFGKYDWIDNFQNGFARVKHGKMSNGLKYANVKWGIINIYGEEKVPAIYDNIWNFYGRKRRNTILELNNEKYLFDFITQDILKI